MTSFPYDVTRMPDDRFPVKPWGITYAYEQDRGEPDGRTVQWTWTQNAARMTAAAANELIRAALTDWMNNPEDTP